MDQQPGNLTYDYNLTELTATSHKTLLEKKILSKIQIICCSPRIVPNGKENYKNGILFPTEKYIYNSGTDTSRIIVTFLYWKGRVQQLDSGILQQISFFPFLYTSL